MTTSIWTGAEATPAEGLAQDTLVVSGPARLRGHVDVSGFKHSLVTIVGAACTANAPLMVTNCPALVETDVLADVLRDLGGVAHRGIGSLVVDAAGITSAESFTVAAERIHGSVYLVPGLLARLGEVAIPTDGGCRIGDSAEGKRPIEQYLSVLERFGAVVDADRAGNPRILATAGLRGCEIDLLDYTAIRPLRTGPLYSGASKMAILCAAVAHGTSLLHNPYPKPDVTDLITVLSEFGADIETTLTGSLVIHGRGPAALDQPVLHRLLPDLIEVVTWVAAGALSADGPLRIRGAGLSRAWAALRPEREVFDRMGIGLDSTANELIVHPAETLRPAEIVVTSPGIYSDCHPFFALLACLAEGTTTIRETVWPKRFGYVAGMRDLGVQLTAGDGAVEIAGVRPPQVADRVVHAPDLRAAAVLLLAALRVPGRTVVTGTHHLARGYPDLVGSLRGLGARIEEEDR
ncbi:hypothetical protein [Amycolatopsis sp. GM8]|uniref:hypothetical protein n=1 Tax=Amycolatopsis sp. GM8 TaxID=2896530 RepID=UPI001F27F7E6|nr:hypothetical protein [Amycolatopsis sp. GM8]